MADQSSKPLVAHVTAKKAIVAERIEHVHINLTRGLDELPTRYDGRVQNFLEYYLGAKDHPAPFGGRASDLAALDAWLDDPTAPPYASLIAPAGRGKSALLAHWITRLASRTADGAEAVHVVYFPISIRFNTNLETVVFASLAARIAHVFGEKVTYTPDTSQYRGVFSDYLRRTPSNGGRVLVVMDGLDEAAGWEAGADLFPTVAPGHLRVIVAARPLALDKDETAWLNRLGWETPNRAQRLSLAGLDREGVRDVLSQMGNPLDALATKIDLISRLYELSTGDPLLVRLYVEALLPQGAQAATLTPEDLAKLQPGLEAYFKRWFEEQQKLWGGAKPLQDKTVRGLLNLCAAALGPLKKDDVLALAPDIFEDSVLLDEAARAVNRFIIGDGLAGGYVFSHPRLAEYFAAKLTDRERQAWQARFLQYGRDTLTALENKTLLPKNAPTYAVQYYGAHLAQTNAPATDFCALICESWLRAWEWLEGTPAGFLNDAERAWQQAEAKGPTALGQQIRAALCFASATSLSANIPKDLLVACVKAEVISPVLGLLMARQKPDPADQAKCLAAIAEFQPSESHTIMSEALSIARTISDEGSLVSVWGALAPSLPESLLTEALSTARAISRGGTRAIVLAKLAPRLSEREQTEVQREALSLARTISDEGVRARVLGEIKPHLSKHEQAEVLVEALLAARAISDAMWRAQVLGELAPQLLEHEQEEVSDEALLAAHAIPENRFRARVLEKFALWLPQCLLDNAISVACTISDEKARAAVLTKIASRLSKNQIGEALSAAQAISDERFRARVLGALAPHFSEDKQTKILAEVLSVARAISEVESCAHILLTIAPCFPEKERNSLLREVVSMVHATADETTRVEILRTLATLVPDGLIEEVFRATLAVFSKFERIRVLRDLVPRLPTSLLKEALLMVRAISDERARTAVLVEIALCLPETDHRAELFDEAFKLVRAIPEESFRTVFWTKLVPRLSERGLADMVGHILTAVRSISDEYDRALVFEELVTHLPESLLGKVLSAARNAFHEGHHARILGKSAQRLSGHESVKMLEEALSLARKISNEQYRAHVLVELVPCFVEREQTEVIGEALSAARKISDEESRAHVLLKLAQCLAGDEQVEVLGEALSVAHKISDEKSRARVLVELAPRFVEYEQYDVLGEAVFTTLGISDERHCAHLLEALAPLMSDNLFGVAFSAAQASSHEAKRVSILQELAPHLPQNLLDEALSMARAISDREYRACVLSELASRFPKHEQAKIVSEALSEARTISLAESRADVLGEIALLLPEHEKVEVLGEAMSAIRSTFFEWTRPKVLEELVPRLPERLLGEVLQMAKALSRHDDIIDLLSSLAPRWSAVCRSTQRSEFEELSATLRAFARTQRPQLIQAIQALLPVIAEQGGEQALRETARAIVDTAKWWP